MEEKLDTDMEMEEEISEIIQLNVDNLVDTEFNEEEFQQGLKDISKVCGMITGLINVGLPPELALTYILNSENNIKEMDMVKIQAKSTIEISKNQKMMLEKNEL